MCIKLCEEKGGKTREKTIRVCKDFSSFCFVFESVVFVVVVLLLFFKWGEIKSKELIFPIQLFCFVLYTLYIFDRI